MKPLKALVITILVAIGVLVLALGSRESRAVPGDSVRIQYWEKWTGDEAEGMRRIVDWFNETVGREKKIHVEYISMSQIDQKTLVATAAGVPPDVAGLWDSQLVQFAAMNALEPLDDLAAAAGITPEHYKPIYWKGCTYNGRLWGLISTPASIALHYNKQAFQERAAELRAAGLDPGRPPQTLDELDRYAELLTTYETVGGRKRIRSSGHLPLEPGWYITLICHWFGGEIFSSKTGELTLESEPMRRGFDWIASYSLKYGKDSITEFRSGLGGFASAQNPFLTGAVVMEQQGPWMANFIDDLAPAMNRWGVPEEKIRREKAFSQLRKGMSLAEVKSLLGEAAGAGPVLTWDAGIKTITARFADGQLADCQMDYLPALRRREMTQWAAAPFPSAVPGLRDVTYCAFDALVIPRGSKHKREAFEFIAFVNRQDVMEKLCADHCKNSPLREVSRHFIDYHPNPYIQVFDDLANSPNAFALPRIPIWPEVNDELNVATQKCYLLEQSPQEALRTAAERSREKWDYYRRTQKSRQQAAHPGTGGAS